MIGSWGGYEIGRGGWWVSVVCESERERSKGGNDSFICFATEHGDSWLGFLSWRWM